MKYAFAQMAFGLGATALVARDTTQCVQLKASGGASGPIGQLSDGQNRIGGENPTGCYCLTNGGFTDASGRGCVLTGDTFQFQCDAGKEPTGGFALNKDGLVTYGGEGGSKWSACPVNDNGEYNIYSKNPNGQTKCVEITMASAGSCGSSPVSSKAAVSSTAAVSSKAAQSSGKASETPYQTAPVASSKPVEYPVASSKPAVMSSAAPTPSKASETPYTTLVVSKSASKPVEVSSYPVASKPATSAPAVSSAQPSKPAAASSYPVAASSAAPKPTPSSPATLGACPADLKGEYQYPHLIVPVNSEQPNKAFGTSYFGAINSTTCSIFNFDLPASYSGKTCSLTFLWPKQEDLETSSFTTSGQGKISFTELTSPATEKTTFADMPAKGMDFGSLAAAPGNSYSIASHACAAGEKIAFELCGTGSFALNFFQDYNPSPIGLYVRTC